MRLWEELAEVRNEGREEGRAVGLSEGHAAGLSEGYPAGILESIENLTKKTGWSVEKAMDALGIPKEEWEKYLKLLDR